jgi:hypothetical protein
MMIPDITVVTPSYRNDFELAVDLCRSLDAHFQARFEHVLIVPRRDLAMFSPLASGHRKILSTEDVLRPRGFRRLPTPTRVRIPGLVDMKLREQWWCAGAGRVSGWVVQQIVKLSAPEFTAAPLLLFVDSDVFLFKDFDTTRFYSGESVKLHRYATGSQLATHQAWYQTALRLLGVTHDAPPMMNYIGNLVAWRREVLLSLRQRLEEVNGLSWWKVIARCRAISEYILYGAYCSAVAQPGTGHVFEDLRLAHSLWTPGTEADIPAVAAAVCDEHVAIHVQSTLPLTIARRRALIGAILAELKLAPAHDTGSVAA